MTTKMLKVLAAPYPGAPISDRHAFQIHRGPGGQPHLIAVGRQLRDQAEPLVSAALDLVDEDATVRTVCFVANRFKTLTPELNDHRYLSMDTCRRVLRRLGGKQ